MACHMMLSTMTLVLACLASIASTVTDQQHRPVITSDDLGNIHIKSGLNGTVFIGGFDILQVFRQQQEMLRNMKGTSARLYVIGGYDGSRLPTVESFNGTHWAREVEMPTARSRLGATVFNNLLYTIGGYDGGVRMTTVETFDGEVWSPASPMPSSRDGDVVVFQDRIYTVGRYVRDDVASFDGVTWTTAPELPTARWDLGVTVYKDKIYAIGGSDGNDVNTVEAFDGISWSPASPMPTSRSALAVAVFQNKIYAVGGYSFPEHLSTVETFDGSSWAGAPPMPTARDRLGLAVFGGKLYAVGGSNGNDLAVVEAFDGTSWQEAPPLPTPRSAPAAVVFPPEE